MLLELGGEMLYPAGQESRGFEGNGDQLSLAGA